MKRHSFFLSGLALISLIPKADAIVVANYSDPTNLRFNNSSTFIGNNVDPAGNDFDLSGVGRLSRLSPADQARVEAGGIALREGTWATALGPNYFLSANHFQPDAGSEITFYAGNSTSSNSFTYQVGGGFRVGNTDLWIGYTVTEIDQSIARYGYAATPASTLEDLGLGNEQLYLSGDLLAGRPGTVTDQVLATNQAESFYNHPETEFESPNGSGVDVPFTPPSGFANDMIILFQNLAGDDQNPTTHESLVQGGDSGSPLFRASGNTLTVLGVASLATTSVDGNFIDTFFPDPIEQRGASFYSYTGSYTTELDAAIALVPDPIPEPSTALILTLGLGLGLRRQR
jgi:hypothetical protein